MRRRSTRAAPMERTRDKMSRKRIAVEAFAAALSVCACLLAAPFDEEDLAASDPRVHTSDLLRVAPLGDRMLFVASRTAAYEPHAIVGFVVGPQGTAELHATDYLP